MLLWGDISDMQMEISFAQANEDPATVSKWCTNKSQPDLATLANVAKLLEVEMKDLLNNINQ